MRGLILLLALACTSPVIAGANDEIGALVDGFHGAAARSDFDDYFSRFTADAYFLGTDATERWSVPEFRAYARPAFAAGRGWVYEVVERNIERGADTDTAWFDEILVNAVLGRCRGTGVVTRQNGEWKIAHYSLTLLIPNEIADEVGERSMAADGIAP